MLLFILLALLGMRYGVLVDVFEAAEYLKYSTLSILHSGIVAFKCLQIFP